MAKVSVVIPCYNAARFLEPCLDSVLAQTLRDIEVICVDDGSTDSTPEVLRRYAAADSRLRVLTQPNQNAGVARNHGMEAAKGKYLAFLDADDTFAPAMLAALYAKCEAEQAEIALCDYDIYDMRTGRVTHEPAHLRRDAIPGFTPFSPYDVPDRLFNLCNPAPWSKLFLHDFVRRHGLRFQALERCNDIFFTCAALALAKRLTVCDRRFVTLRRGTATSLTETMDQNPLCFYEATRALKAFLLEKGLFAAFEIAFHHLALGNALYALNRTKTKEQWLNVATFLKERFIPEFRLWENRKHSAEWAEGSRQLRLLKRSSFYALARHRPSLRTDERTAPEPDPAWTMAINTAATAVSVIIPIYNTEAYLHECLLSVQNQTLRNIEVLCVDDGSTDGSAGIVAAISAADPRFILLRQENQGQSAARNHALAQATGAYVYFLDSDDALTPRALETLYRQARFHKLDSLFCEATSFFDPIELYRSHHNRLNAYRFPDGFPAPAEAVSGRELLALMAQKNVFYPTVWLQLYRRQFLTNQGLSFFPGIYHEDDVFTLRTLDSAARTAVHPEALHLRRIRPESTMNIQTDWKHILGRLACLLEVEALTLKAQEAGDTDYLAVLGQHRRRYRYLLNTAYKNRPGEFPEPSSALIQAFGGKIPLVVVALTQATPSRRGRTAQKAQQPSWAYPLICKAKPVLAPMVLWSPWLAERAYRWYWRLGRASQVQT